MKTLFYLSFILLTYQSLASTCPTAFQPKKYETKKELLQDLEKMSSDDKSEPQFIDSVIDLLIIQNNKNEEVIDHELLEKLISEKVDLKAKSDSGDFIFYNLLELGDARGVKMALDTGLDPNQAIQPNGDVPAHFVYREAVTQAENNSPIEKYIEVLRILKEAGADFNIKNKRFGNYFLDLFAEVAPWGNTNQKTVKKAIFKKLIEWGLDFTAQDYEGNTILHKLVVSKHNVFEEMKFAIEMGASLTAKNKKGDNPMVYASKEGLGLHNISVVLEAKRSVIYITLGKLIAFLEPHKDSDFEIAFEGFLQEERPDIKGLSDPHSYRVYNSDLAFEPNLEKKTTAGELLKMARQALNREFTGYKGGEFLITKDTPICISEYGRCLNAYISSIYADEKKQTIYLVTKEHL